MFTRPNKGCPRGTWAGRWLLLLAALPLVGRAGPAATFHITDTSDSTRPTSLRGAILAASQHGGHGTIYLGQAPVRGKARPVSWVFHLTIPGPLTADDLGGALSITGGNVTIIGAVSNVVIDATGLNQRVFQVFPNAQLTLQNVTITGGAPQIYGYYPTQLSFTSDDGGGIYNAGNLVLNNCIIRGNFTGVGSMNLAGDYPFTFGGDGGGVFNSGTLVMNDCQITSNSCAAANFSGGNGGGINNSGIAILNGCLINDNSAGSGLDGIGLFGNLAIVFGGSGGSGGSGGGLFNTGRMEATDCSIAGNQSGEGGNGYGADTGGNGGAGGDGAGICNLGDLSLNTCTISGNICGGGGAGGNAGLPYENGNGGDGGSGGAIYNGGSFAITSCTMILNQAGEGANGGNAEPDNNLHYPPPGPGFPAESGGDGGSGGGIMNDATNTAVSVRNTLIALNEANAPGLGGTYSFDYPTEGASGENGIPGYGPDVGGNFTSAGFNLIGAADGSTGFTNRLRADQVGSVAQPIDPLIGPLQMNGGPTPTHALRAGSPAINQGNCFGIHEDQRGYRRPWKYPGIAFATGGDGSDIGAFELETLLPKE